MDYNKKEIIKQAVSMIGSALFALGCLVMIFFAKKHGGDAAGKGIVLFAFMMLFFLLIAWSNYRALRDAIKIYRSNINGNVILELQRLIPYESQKEMISAFNEEKKTAIFQDDDFVITRSFFVSLTENTVFYLNGIVDAKPVVQKINGVIEYVNLHILYCDGIEYEFKICRKPLEMINMQEKANKIEFVANIIASKSENFRKYPTYRFNH